MILDEIVAVRRQSLEKQKRLQPESVLRQRLAAGRRDASRPVEGRPRTGRFAAALSGHDGSRPAGGVRIIAEVKRASPSRGVLAGEWHPGELARAYEAGGASAVSVLTEEHFFLGSNRDLELVRGSVNLPVLRKDFLIDPYQCYESAILGADAVLLIVRLLEPALLAEMLGLCRELGLDALVEVHDEPELEIALKAGAGIVGINNRDLRTFAVDLGVTLRLAPLLPTDVIPVAESGIRTPSQLAELARAGVRAALVGESLVRAGDPATAVRRLLEGAGLSPGDALLRRERHDLG